MGFLTGVDSDDAFGGDGCHHAATKTVKADLCIGNEEHLERSSDVYVKQPPPQRFQQKAKTTKKIHRLTRLPGNQRLQKQDALLLPAVKEAEVSGNQTRTAAAAQHLNPPDQREAGHGVIEQLHFQPLSSPSV